MTTRDIVFVHGMFMNPRSWSGWVEYFTARGYACHTVAWPGHDGEPAALRAQPPEVLRTLRLADVMKTHRAFLDGLPAKPLVVGHSMGGLITQLLVAEGRAAAGVAIDSAPPRGVVVPSWSFLKANLPVVNPFAGDAPFLFTLEQFHYAFCHTLPLDAARDVYERLVVPEGRNVARSPTGPDAEIDFTRPHAPLLFLAGELDTIVPAKLNEKNFRAYRDAGSTREFKLLPGRTHYVCGQPGWEETAGLVHDWLRDR